MKTSLLLLLSAVLVGSIHARVDVPVHKKRACASCFYRAQMALSCGCGVYLNRIGCPTGRCRSCRYYHRCRPVPCLINCPGGYCHDWHSGCPVCYCRAYYLY